jgi:hypothetical protein
VASAGDTVDDSLAIAETVHQSPRGGRRLIQFLIPYQGVIGPITGLIVDVSKLAVFAIFAVLGFITVVAISLTVRAWFTETEALPKRADLGSASSVLNRNTILLALMTVIGGLVIYGYLGMYPTFLREVLKYSPAAAGTVMSMYGLGALVSIGGGWLGDRFSPRIVLTGAFLTTAVLGYLLFHTSGAVTQQIILSFIWGVVVSGTIYVNLAGYLVKSLRSNLSSRGSGIFVTTLYGSASIAGNPSDGCDAAVGDGRCGPVHTSFDYCTGLALALRTRRYDLATD